MKAKYIVILSFFLCFHTMVSAQTSWRKDSLQFKVYTRVYYNAQKQVDSIVAQKNKCHYCSQKQMLALRKEALRRTQADIDNSLYKKNGVRQIAHYIRISKKDFEKINDTTFKKINIIVPKKNSF
ncbi:hypothetical protein [Dokdonia sp.]|uniref:hypothetical protein n=1 Tax=Dokdonia sp. TaxID=2024995 RepID=UPI0032643446